MRRSKRGRVGERHGEARRRACKAVLDGVLVGNPAGVAAAPLGEQVAQGLVVDLHEARDQVVLPALLPQRVHRVQDLRAQAGPLKPTLGHSLLAVACRVLCLPTSELLGDAAYQSLVWQQKVPFRNSSTGNQHDLTKRA